MGSLTAKQAEALKGASAETLRALGANPREVIEHNRKACERDIRNAAFEIIEYAMPFAQHPERQEFSREQAIRIINAAHALVGSVDELKEHNDEMDAL